MKPGKIMADYVKRLQEVIDRPDACTTCPSIGQSVFCNDCRGFIGLKENLGPCPCKAFKDKNIALERAQNAINRWNKGTHKWQKGKN